MRNKQGQFGEAVKLFDQALSLDQTNANAHADLAYSYLGLDQPDLARQQLSTLIDMGTDQSNSLALELQRAIGTPKFLYVDSQKGNFNTLFGPGTTLTQLDPSLAAAGASKTFTMAFTFNTAMDIGSVQNVLNWSITRAAGGKGGVYNHGANLHPDQEISIAPIPISVTYDPVTHTAKVEFKITQNAAADGVIDPLHWVFQFQGKDATGRRMDTHGDQYDGYGFLPY